MAALIPSASATGSGTMTLAGPSTNSNQTITIPDATGTMMVSGNMPAFSAYKSSGAGSQSLSAGVNTKITFDTEEFDTNNNFASSRFTPTVAGYYLITGSATGSNTSYTYMQIAVWKNGGAFKGGANFSQTASYPVTTVSALVYLNGSTDYVELYVAQSATAVVLTGADSTYFQGVLVRSA